MQSENALYLKESFLFPYNSVFYISSYIITSVILHLFPYFFGKTICSTLKSSTDKKWLKLCLKEILEAFIINVGGLCAKAGSWGRFSKFSTELVSCIDDTHGKYISRFHFVMKWWTEICSKFMHLLNNSSNSLPCQEGLRRKYIFKKKEKQI